MSDITIRPRVPEDDEKYLAARNAIASDRAPVTLEEHRRFIELEPERTGHTIVTAEREGEALGHASWALRVHTSDQNTFWLDILVDRNHWRSGVGSALYAYAMQQLTERGAKKVFVQIREDIPEAETFAARRGFTRTGHGDRISRLAVQTANLVKTREAAQRVEESGIRITTLAQMTVDEALLEELRALDQEVTVDIPGEEDYQAPPLDEWKLWMDMPGLSHDIFWVALDGDKIIGMAPLQRRAGGYADNAFTAVARAYRGRGIARALKLRTVEWAQQNGIHSIITGNDPANKPMLAINIDLGYQFLPANIQLAKEL